MASEEEEPNDLPPTGPATERSRCVGGRGLGSVSQCPQTAPGPGTDTVKTGQFL